MDYFEDLRSVFSGVSRPTSVEGDGMGLEASTKQIERLLRADPTTLTADDFSGYVGYAGSTTGGFDDFIYLTPAMLRVWRQTILQRQEHWFPHYFHSNVATLNAFSHLGVHRTAIVARYLRATLLECVDLEDSLKINGKSASHEWFRNVASYGVMTNDLPSLWNEIWSSSSAGRARAVLQYASAIVCDAATNPIFAPWTTYGGGGTPLPWHYNSVGFQECWKADNVRFLRETLTIEYLADRISAAADQLADEERAVGNSILEELQTGDAGRTEARCRALAEAFATPSDSKLTDWTTFGAW